MDDSVNSRGFGHRLHILGSAKKYDSHFMIKSQPFNLKAFLSVWYLTVRKYTNVTLNATRTTQCRGYLAPSKLDSKIDVTHIFKQRFTVVAVNIDSLDSFFFFQISSITINMANGFAHEFSPAVCACESVLFLLRFEQSI